MWLCFNPPRPLSRPIGSWAVQAHTQGTGEPFDPNMSTMARPPALQLQTPGPVEVYEHSLSAAGAGQYKGGNIYEPC